MRALRGYKLLRQGSIGSHFTVVQNNTTRIQLLENASFAHGAPSVSVIVPVFGDAAALEELTVRAAAVLDRIATRWELIFVNDGSDPPTWEKILQLASLRSNVRGIDLLRNFGQHNALLAGIRSARGEAIVTIDDDLQHPPEEIPRLLDSLKGADLVYGTPTNRVRGVGRSLAAAVSKAALASVLGTAHARDIGAFRVFRAHLRQVFAEYDSPYVSIDVLLSWATTRITAVSVRYEPRKRGQSSYGIWGLLSLTINMITGFSVWPLRLASIIGLVFAAFGVAALALVVFRYFAGGATVPGFPFLASLISIFAGAQLFTLGIMGEYLARMYFRTMRRPPYIVRSTANLGTQEKA